MQGDFHYYATYCAALIAGYSHDEAMAICYSAQHTDYCSRTFLKSVGGPLSVATTQLSGELSGFPTDIAGIHDITRIWASFHFLPKDLYAEYPEEKRPKPFMRKYRMLCGPNGQLVSDTVERARNKSLQAVGIAMHVLADTWAHANFAGTPSLVINNSNSEFYEVDPDSETGLSRVKFKHNPAVPDDPEKHSFCCSIFQDDETSIMNLGHGRAGHFPDYSFARYKYMPAWGNGRYIDKDNPSDYYHAFCQMVLAMQYTRGAIPEFTLNTYAEDEVAPWADEIRAIIGKRRLIASNDWKKLGEKLSGETVEDYTKFRYNDEYKEACDKSDTFLGKYFIAAKAHKRMIADKVRESGNPLCGKKNEIFRSDLKSEHAFLKDITDYIKLKNQKAEKEEGMTA